MLIKSHSLDIVVLEVICISVYGKNHKLKSGMPSEM